MNHQRDISELIHAIVPPLRWSPVAWLMTMMSAVVMVACILFFCSKNDSAMVMILFALPGVVFVICLVWLHYRCQHGFFTNGILYRIFFRDIAILFADIESYSLIPIVKSSLRDKMMGKPAVYQYRITVFLKEDRPLKKVTILSFENDDRFESFLDHLRTAIARRMYDDFQKDKGFYWTPRVRVLKQGIEFLGNAKNASNRDVFIPLCELDGSRLFEVPTVRIKCKKTFWQTIETLWFIFNPLSSILTGTFQTATEENKVFHLYRAGCDEPKIVISCTSPNFHPGYDAFRRIVWESDGMDTNFTCTDWRVL